MKKTLYVFVALVMLLSVVVSCAPAPTEAPPEEPAEPPPEPPAAPAEFKFSTWGDETFFLDGFERMQKAYPEYADVEWVSMPTGGSDELMAKLIVDSAAESWDTMPDVAEMGANRIPQLADAGLLVELTDKMAPYVDDLSPAVLEGVSWNGKVWAVPWMPNTAMIWYNQEVFEMAGVNADDIETWDDFMAAGKTIRDFEFPDGVDRYIANADIAWGPGMALQISLQQECTSYFDPDTGDLTIDTDPHFRKVFQWWVDAYNEGILLEVEEWETPWFNALNEGMIATYPSANWMDQIIQLDLEDQEGKWRAMKFPAWESGGSRAGFEAGSANVVILNKPDIDVDLAWTFMEYSFLNPDVTGDLVSAHMLVPAYLPAFEHPYYSDPNPFYGGQELGALDKEIQEEATCAFNYTEHFGEATDLILVEMQEVWAGNKDVDTAIADAAASIRDAIE
jgi:lactose/L-arabinose transport system substrate-binding protein